jgi:hypothetical protein
MASRRRTRLTSAPYNPLDTLNLARSIEIELLARDAIALSAAADIKGAGVYAIYYTGGFAPYGPIASANRSTPSKPIYVGKAIPKGGRKGGLMADAGTGRALAERLGQHAQSITETSNLRIDDFVFRYLVVADIWIPLGENMLINTFKPVWNRAIDGFGNKDPGRRRATQYKSPWDVLHPGRAFADKLADSALTPEFLEQRIADYFAGRTLAKLPRKIEEQIEAEQAEAEDGVDEA